MGQSLSQASVRIPSAHAPTPPPAGRLFSLSEPSEQPNGKTAQRAQLLRARAEALFVRLSPYGGAGLRNHCLRLYRFAEKLLHKAGLSVDPALLYALALTHDLGLVTAEAAGTDYLQRSWTLFREATADLGLGQREQELARQCLLFNHRIVPMAGLLPEAWLFRQAVWVEHSRGALRHGLERSAVAQIFFELPRANFDWVLIDFARRVLTHEPRTLLRGIFL